MRKVTTHSPAETQALGEEIARGLAPGAVVGFVGELGSGKTCLVQGICRALGVQGPVTSPTFILVNEYPGRLASGMDTTVYHFDLYRLGGPEELDDLGCDDYFYGGGVCLVEWADMAGDLLPNTALHIRIEPEDEMTRTLILDGDPACAR